MNLMSGCSIETLLHHHEGLVSSPPEFREIAKLGETLTIISDPFALPLDNNELLAFSLHLGLPPEQASMAQSAIANTGFTRRFISFHPDERPDPVEQLDRASTNGAILLKEILSVHGWDKPDIFIDTSAFLPTSLNQHILEKAGFNPDQIYSRSYRFACAGAVTAFIDCLSDPSLRDARIVIAAIEPLSQLIDRVPYTSPKSLTIPAIFGDGNALLAFSPKDFHLDTAMVLVQPDGGVIKLKTQYNYPTTPLDTTSIPAHYHFAGGGESILHHSAVGAYLDIAEPLTGSTISMDGIRTGLFFGDHTSQLIIELLNHFGNPQLLKHIGNNIILHPASEPVVNRIAKLLERNGYLDSPRLPFLMDQAREPNSSSATTLNRWRYMLQHEMVDPTLPILWIAPGAGSVIAGAIGHIKL